MGVRVVDVLNVCVTNTVTIPSARSTGLPSETKREERLVHTREWPDNSSERSPAMRCLPHSRPDERSSSAGIYGSTNG